MRLRFLYDTKVKFSQMVGQHNILLRCLPVETAFQHVTACSFMLSDGFWWQEGADAFGNRIITGGTSGMHDELWYRVEGEVEQSVYCIPDAQPHPMYGVASRLTTLPQDYDIADLRASLEGRDFLGKCLEVMHFVHGMLEYRGGVTNMQTTVAELLEKRQGVCQDYSHLMIALCRKAGLKARYANGFIKGEGETHAWVEVSDGQCWYAFDPTNDTAVASGFIKLAHGRDAMDCPVARGLYSKAPLLFQQGFVEENGEVTVSVT